jgi:predicted Rossmann-fold nucleotide-binding protein
MSSEIEVPIDPAVAKGAFCSQAAKKSLRVTCYGSSSAKTPERYLKEARSLGYILAKRGHVCVNGAGSYGCMAAMNDGAVAGNGHIVGVIHEMFLVDGPDGSWRDGKKIDRDGGAHRAFDSVVSQDPPPEERTGPIREILVAGGDDLQQRKKFLVDKAEALIVLPGGPGTWDEVGGPN